MKCQSLKIAQRASCSVLPLRHTSRLSCRHLASAHTVSPFTQQLFSREAVYRSKQRTANRRKFRVFSASAKAQTIDSQSDDESDDSQSHSQSDAESHDEHASNAESETRHNSEEESHYDFTGDSETEHELAFDPSFDNVVHGVFTRADFDRRDQKTYAEIGTLGRLFIYQFECCPFSGKVKALLDRFNVMYSLIEVSPLSRKQLPNTAHFMHDRQVPVLMCSRLSTAATVKQQRSVASHKVLYQSNAIVESLLHYLSTRDIVPLHVCERANAAVVKQWIDWLDNTLIPLLYLKVDSTDELVAEYFSYLGQFNKFKSLGLTGTPVNVASAVMFHNQCKHLRHKYSVLPGMEDDSLLEALSEWNEVTRDTFHGGADLDLADVMCFGILRTFSRLSFFEALLKDSGVGDWYHAAEEVVGQHSCISHS